MEELDSIQMFSSKEWVCLLKGRFYLCERSVFFLSLAESRMLVLFELKEGQIVTKTLLPTSFLPNISSKWILDIKSRNRILVGDSYIVNLSTKTIQKTNASDLELFNNSQKSNVFIFGDYSIFYDDMFNYTCKKNSSTMWQFKAKGYLYTDIELNNKTLLFGTDGRGGHFYGVDIESGVLRFDFDTGGINQFCVDNKKVFFLNKKCNSVYMVSLDDFTVDACPVTIGKVTFESSLFVDNNNLYITTYKEGKLETKGYLSSYIIQ